MSKKNETQPGSLSGSTQPNEDSSSEALQSLRLTINSLDEKILELLQERARAAKQVGCIKKQKNWAFHVPERERTIVERLKALNALSDFPSESIGPVFREIMSACLKLESPISVAYLGPGTTFSFLALRRAFGASASALPENSIEGVFDALENGRCQYAIVPLENSVEGTVNTSMQRMITTPAIVHAEVYVPVCHNLVSKAKNMSEVTTVMSHPQALAQCRQWLREHIPKATCVETSSTVMACREAAQSSDRSGLAAISTVAAALEEGLQVLVSNIHDHAENETRFLILALEKTLSERPTDKTTLVFSVPDTQGQLAKVLNELARHGANLLKIESVPNRTAPWRAMFWCDLHGPASLDANVNALAHIKPFCDQVKLVGSYSRLE